MPSCLNRCLSDERLPMKIAAIVEHRITEGGGFNQALNAILQVNEIIKGWGELIVVTTVAENIPFLRQLKIEARMIRPSWKDKLLWFFARSSVGRHIQTRMRLVGSIESTLIAGGVDLVYFVTPSSRPLGLQHLNYISTVWDACHRDTPEFPEVREFNKFHARESEYRSILPGAILVLTDSPQLSQRLALFYGLDPARFLAMPFSCSPFLNDQKGGGTGEVLAKHGLSEGFYFYPAQFWSHKNHVRIVQALKLLADRGTSATVVFVGSDKGNCAYVKTLAQTLGVASRVKFLGFVPAEDMDALYAGCLAVVMPTYFGPTNLPPLEAWAAGRPLVYSRHLAVNAGEAALLVDPDSAEELAAAMAQCADPIVARRLVEAGRERLAEIQQTRRAAESEMGRRLRQFAVRRECWPRSAV
jgi:glycosyltransferase involved in cell wall biosynthesis